MMNKLRNLIPFKIGDTVRISRIKGIFEHGFLPNWTEQIYKYTKSTSRNQLHTF